MTSVLAFVALVIGAPLVPGIIGRTKAIAAGRRGPPLWQLYADLLKLARRGVVYSRTTTWMFRLAPVLLAVTTLAAASLVPLDGRASLLRFGGDAVAFAYVLALGRFSLVLASLDTGSSFEGMGASREATIASLVETGLFTSFAALGLLSVDFSISGMLAGADTMHVASLATAPSVMLAVSLFALMLAECSRVPIDDPTTHLELTMVHEVMVLDHSGPDLALILYANALKVTLFGAIVVQILMPGFRGTWTGTGVLVASFVVTGIAVGIVESVMARLRLTRIPLYVASASALGLFGLILLLR